MRCVEVAYNAIFLMSSYAKGRPNKNLKPKTKVETNVILHLHSCFKLIVKNQDCQRNSKKVHLMQYTAGSLTEQVSFILSLFSQEKTAKGDGFPKSVSIYWRLYFL